MDPIKDLEFEQYYEQDFELLINAFIEIGNSVDGQKTIGDQRLYYAEGIGQKVMSHAISAHYLAKGYQVQGNNYSYRPQVDFGSMIVLTRAALESYLTLNYVFVSGADEEEKKFHHAHSSRLSIIQVQQTKDLTSQIDMAKASIAILMVVLAKFMYDYIHLIPELKHLAESDPRYVMIRTWKMIGESLPH